jgi:hypothetical protein
MTVYTYEKRLGWRNTELRPAGKGDHIGEIFDWMTQNGVPVIVPDQWEDSAKGMTLERLPDEIEIAVRIGE